MAITTNGGAGITADAVATLTNKTLVSPIIQDPTINGTTTNINTTNLVVEDKNIVINDVVSPSDTNADGGGISLSGATTKTLNWVNSTSAWTSSEHLNLASGKSYYVNGTLLKDVSEVLSNKTFAASSANAAMASLMGYTSTATAAGTTTLTATSSYYQQFTGTTTQTVQLPVVSTLATGWTFHIVNNSTGIVSVVSSGSNAVIDVPSQTTAMVTCIAITGTTAASWESGITDFSTVVGSGSAVMVSGAGTSGQVLTSTGSGTQWATPAAGTTANDQAFAFAVQVFA
jgi:hypothetical protein